MRRFAVLLAMLAPGALAAQDGAGWWQGIWAFDKAWCEVADQIGMLTPAPIAITSDEVLGYENACTITRVRQAVEVNAVFLALECQAEGGTHAETRLIMRADDSIWIWFGGGEPVQFHACDGG